MRTRAAPPLALVLIGLAAVVALVHATGQGPIYSVAALQGAERHDPSGWAGRTVRVRGVIVAAIDPGCTAAGATCFRLLLRDPPAAATGATLALALGPPDPVLARLRSLPWLAGLLPRPQDLVFERTTIYRLRLERSPDGSLGCAGPPCYRGEVLDAAPVLGGP